MGRGTTTRIRLADRLTQGFTGLIQSHITPPSFNWPKTQPHKLFEVEFPAQSFVTRDLGLGIEKNAHVVSAIFDAGSTLGQAGVDFGANLNGAVQQFVRRLSVPFRHEEDAVVLRVDTGFQRNADLGVNTLVHEDIGALTKRIEDFGCCETKKMKDETDEEVVPADSLQLAPFSGKSQSCQRITRIGLWGSSTCGNPWSFPLDNNQKLRQIRIDHKDWIYSLAFTTQDSNGSLHYSQHYGGERGDTGGRISEVNFDAEEQIVGIVGTVGITSGWPLTTGWVKGLTVISSLSFVTNKKTDGPFGREAGGIRFSVPWDAGSFAGFYGRAGLYMDGLGCYLKSVTLLE